MGGGKNSTTTWFFYGVRITPRDIIHMPNREEFWMVGACIVFPVFSTTTNIWNSEAEERKSWILYIWLPPLHEVAKRGLLSRSTFTIQVIPLEKLIHICGLRRHTCTYLNAIKTEWLSKKPKLNSSKEKDCKCKRKASMCKCKSSSS